MRLRQRVPGSFLGVRNRDRGHTSLEELEHQRGEMVIYNLDHREILHKALNKHRAGGEHNAKSARVIELRYFEEMDTSRIATIVGTTRGYVGQLFSADYPQVRKILMDDFGLTGTEL
jgi:DNA-directed RNA polymerase specialized sigma subunit